MLSAATAVVVESPRLDLEAARPGAGRRAGDRAGLRIEGQAGRGASPWRSTTGRERFRRRRERRGIGAAGLRGRQARRLHHQRCPDDLGERCRGGGHEGAVAGVGRDDMVGPSGQGRGRRRRGAARAQRDGQADRQAGVGVDERDRAGRGVRGRHGAGGDRRGQRHRRAGVDRVGARADRGLRRHLRDPRDARSAAAAERVADRHGLRRARPGRAAGAAAAAGPGAERPRRTARRRCRPWLRRRRPRRCLGRCPRCCRPTDWPAGPGADA